MTIQPTFMLIADICGYTRFMKFHRSSLAHAQEIIAQLLETIIHTAMFSGFCYTQFADTFQEANGLLYADRTPKIPLERIRKVTSMSRRPAACN